MKKLLITTIAFAVIATGALFASANDLASIEAAQAVYRAPQPIEASIHFTWTAEKHLVVYNNSGIGVDMDNLILQAQTARQLMTEMMLILQRNDAARAQAAQEVYSAEN